MPSVRTSSICVVVKSKNTWQFFKKVHVFKPLNFFFLLFPYWAEEIVPPFRNMKINVDAPDGSKLKKTLSFNRLPVSSIS